MIYSIHDPRPVSEKEQDISALDGITQILKQFIADHALESQEHLYDEENQEILRRLVFSQGTRSYFLIIAPDGYIRLMDHKFPRTLLLDVHNVLMRA
jgi:hypothetical protein